MDGHWNEMLHINTLYIIDADFQKINDSYSLLEIIPSIFGETSTTTTTWKRSDMGIPVFGEQLRTTVIDNIAKNSIVPIEIRGHSCLSEQSCQLIQTRY